MQFFTLVLLGLSVGLDNFAVSLAIGLAGLALTKRLQIAIVFSLFETGMLLVGLLTGRVVASWLGSRASLIGGLVLGLAGLYVIVDALRSEQKTEPSQKVPDFRELLFTGLAISLDNVVIGFGLGTLREPLLEVTLAVGVASISLSLLGLELGNRLGQYVGKYSALISGVVLLVIGAALSLGIL